VRNAGEDHDQLMNRNFTAEALSRGEEGISGACHLQVSIENNVPGPDLLPLLLS